VRHGEHFIVLVFPLAQETQYIQPGTMGAKSGIQKEVLALYRALLREASKKDKVVATTTTTNGLAKAASSSIDGPSFSSLLFAENDGSSTAHARNEFRRQASKISRKDFRAIEYKIRHGYKQIKLLKMPGVVTFKSW